MAFGVLDTRYIDLPPNIDVAYVQGLKTAAGVSFQTVLQQIDARLTTFNGGIDPLAAALIYPTDQVTAERMQPIAFEVSASSELSVPRAQFTDGAASALPLRKWDVALQWTEDGLEEMSLNKILLQIDSVILGLKSHSRKEIFRRLFSDAEIRVDRTTTMVNPGFAGSGTGLNAFTTPFPSGAALPGGYTLYHRDTAANLGVALKTMRDKLKKWQKGPFDVIAPADQIAAITALTGFYFTGSPLIRPDQTKPEALVDPELYVGVFDNDIRIRHAIDDFTDPNIAMFKSSGALNPANPLAWRYDSRAGRGRDAFLRSRSMYPLDQSIVVQRYGIGVANRTAVALLRVGASGGYVAPTI